VKGIESIIERQMRRWEAERAREREEQAAAPTVQSGMPSPLVTISREEGADGARIARLLADRLDFEVFDQRIVDHISAATGVRQQIIEYLEDRRRSALLLWVDGVIRSRWVTQSDYVKSLVEVLGSVAELGRVVIMGRGANFIFGIERGVHVRVVAPIEVRARRIAGERRCSLDEARRYAEETDDARGRFIRSHFDADWSDPHAYHLIVNTAVIRPEDAVDLILRVVERQD